jgi:tetratricopeptide (TPR) repeat protein
VYNNLANLLAPDVHNLDEARQLYERAISIHRGLVAKEPGNREYKLELAKFLNNHAAHVHAMGRIDAAIESNAGALALIDELALPAPSLGIEQADAHSLRGRIMHARSVSNATAEYRDALSLFQDLAAKGDVASRGDFHLRFGDLLLNLATLCRERQDADNARKVLSEAVDFYVALGQRAAAVRDHVGARMVLENLSRLMPELSERDRRAFTRPFETLQQTLDAHPSTRD